MDGGRARVRREVRAVVPNESVTSPKPYDLVRNANHLVEELARPWVCAGASRAAIGRVSGNRCSI